MIAWLLIGAAWAVECVPATIEASVPDWERTWERPGVAMDVRAAVTCLREGASIERRKAARLLVLAARVVNARSDGTLGEVVGLLLDARSQDPGLGFQRPDPLLPTWTRHVVGKAPVPLKETGPTDAASALTTLAPYLDALRVAHDRQPVPGWPGRKVGMAEIFVPPVFTEERPAWDEPPRAPDAGADRPPTDEVSHGLDELLDLPAVVVLGPAGSGKSFLCKALAWRYAGERGRVPFVVKLRNLEAGDWAAVEHDWRRLIVRVARRDRPELPANDAEAAVRLLAADRRLVVMFDGLDEVRGTPRETDAREMFAAAVRDAPGLVLLTSRPVGFAPLLDLDVPTWRIEGLDAEGQYRITQVLLRPEDRSPFLFALRDDPVAADLATSPLLLDYLAAEWNETHVLSERKSTLVSRTIDRLVLRWVDDDEKAAKTDPVAVRALLRRLTWELAQEGVDVFDAARVDALADDPVFASIDTVGLLGRSGVVEPAGRREDGTEVYQLLHRSFGDVLAAEHAARGGEAEWRVVGDRYWDPRWQEVSRLTAEWLRDAPAALRKAYVAALLPGGDNLVYDREVLVSEAIRAMGDPVELRAVRDAIDGAMLSVGPKWWEREGRAVLSDAMLVALVEDPTRVWNEGEARRECARAEAGSTDRDECALRWRAAALGAVAAQGPSVGPEVRRAVRALAVRECARDGRLDYPSEAGIAFAVLPRQERQTERACLLLPALEYAESGSAGPAEWVVPALQGTIEESEAVAAFVATRLVVEEETWGPVVKSLLAADAPSEVQVGLRILQRSDAGSAPYAGALLRVAERTDRLDWDTRRLLMSLLGRLPTNALSPFRPFLQAELERRGESEEGAAWARLAPTLRQGGILPLVRAAWNEESRRSYIDGEFESAPLEVAYTAYAPWMGGWDADRLLAASEWQVYGLVAPAWIERLPDAAVADLASRFRARLDSPPPESTGGAVFRGMALARIGTRLHEPCPTDLGERLRARDGWRGWVALGFLSQRPECRVAVEDVLHEVAARGGPLGWEIAWYSLAPSDTALRRFVFLLSKYDEVPRWPILLGLPGRLVDPSVPLAERRVLAARHGPNSVMWAYLLLEPPRDADCRVATAFAARSAAAPTFGLRFVAPALARCGAEGGPRAWRPVARKLTRTGISIANVSFYTLAAQGALRFADLPPELDHLRAWRRRLPELVARLRQ